jgi:hypothetical protein
VSVHTLHLVWKYNGLDIDLGTCYSTIRPMVGEIINYHSEQSPDHRGPWRVVLVYHQPFMPGSQTWVEWKTRGRQPEDSMTYYWVEPAEGPWEN